MLFVLFCLIIIDGISKQIIVHIDLAASFDELDLIVHPPVLEEPYGLFYGELATMEGGILRDYLLHPGADASDIFRSDRSAVRLLQLTEESVADGMPDTY